VVGVAMILVLALYVVLLLRRLYGDGWAAAGAKALVVLVIGAVSDSILSYAALAIALLTA